MTSVASSASSGAQEKSGKKPRGPYSKSRVLTRWNPGLDQLLLLILEAISSQQGNVIDWDAAGKMMSPNMTGEAIKQHLAKVTKARVKAGLPVPEKPKKATRRKASQLVAGNPTTPAKGGRNKKITQEEGDDDEAETPSKNSGLLYLPESQKKKKTPGGARGGGRKKANPKKAGDDGDIDNTIETPTKSTGKRGRPTKKKVKDESAQAEESETGTPSKKQKLVPRRASKLNVNYNEQYDSNDDLLYKDEGNDDDDWEDDEGDEKLIMKNENSFSQESNNPYDFAPIPPPGFATPADQTLRQDFAPPQTPNYRSAYGNNTDYSNPYAPYGQGGFLQSPAFGRGQAMNNFGGSFQTDYTAPSAQFGGNPYNPYGTNFESYGGYAPPPTLLPSQPRHTFPSPLATIPEEPQVEEEDEKPVLTRDNTSSGEKKSKNKKKSASQGATQEVENGAAMKVESGESDTGLDPFMGDNTGFHGPGDVNIMNTPSADQFNTHNYGFSDNAGGFGLHLDTNDVPGFDTSVFMTSPAEYNFDNMLAAGTTNTGMTTSYNNTNFASNPEQLSLTTGHTNNSFGSTGTFSSTIAGSLTDEVLQATDPGTQLSSSVNNNGDAFDAAAYGRHMPGDEHLHDALFNMDGFNDGSFEIDEPDDFIQ